MPAIMRSSTNSWRHDRWVTGSESPPGVARLKDDLRTVRTEKAVGVIAKIPQGGNYCDFYGIRRVSSLSERVYLSS